jgi:hypothetical protein
MGNCGFAKSAHSQHESKKYACLSGKCHQVVIAFSPNGAGSDLMVTR